MIVVLQSMLSKVVVLPRVLKSGKSNPEDISQSAVELDNPEQTVVDLVLPKTDASWSKALVWAVVRCTTAAGGLVESENKQAAIVFDPSPPAVRVDVLNALSGSAGLFSHSMATRVLTFSLEVLEPDAPSELTTVAWTVTTLLDPTEDRGYVFPPVALPIVNTASVVTTVSSMRMASVAVLEGTVRVVVTTCSFCCCMCSLSSRMLVCVWCRSTASSSWRRRRWV